MYGVPFRFGSFLSGVDRFDGSAFSIPAAEASLMDPQQRLLLECAGEVLVQGGPAPAGATGIFVGTSSVDYLSVSYE